MKKDSDNRQGLTQDLKRTVICDKKETLEKLNKENWRLMDENSKKYGEENLHDPRQAKVWEDFLSKACGLATTTCKEFTTPTTSDWASQLDGMEDFGEQCVKDGNISVSFETLIK
jgi:hypothetical protein